MFASLVKLIHSYSFSKLLLDMVVAPWAFTVLQRDMNIRQERVASGNHFGFCSWAYLHHPKDSLHGKGQKDPMAPALPLRAAGISSRLTQSCSWVNWCLGAVCGNYLMNSFIEQTTEIERERDERVRKRDVWNRVRCSRKKLLCKELCGGDSAKSIIQTLFPRMEGRLF